MRELSSREAAHLIGVQPETVVRWCAAGRLPGARRVLLGKRWVWRIPEDVVMRVAAEWPPLAQTLAETLEEDGDDVEKH